MASIPPVNEALKSDVDRKFNTGKEKKEKGDEYFKAGETKEGQSPRYLLFVYTRVISYPYL